MRWVTQAQATSTWVPAALSGVGLGSRNSRVPLVTMDSILHAMAMRGHHGTRGQQGAHKGLPPVHAIKLDVEGFEARVFMGGARLMAEELRPKLS